MQNHSYENIKRRFAAFGLVALLVAGTSQFVGCGQATTTTGGTGGGSGGGTTTSDSSGASSFEGVVSGSVAESRSTRESLDAEDGEAAAQALPSDIDPTKVRVVFENLEGELLPDANGQPYPPATVDSTGTFTAEGLPVGVDFVVAVDLEGSGEADVRQIVQIPADESGKAGAVRDVRVDPLTTLIVAKLRELFAEHGVDPRRLGISPTAIVQRVVDAFVHLFEEAGIDQAVTLDDIAGLTGGRAGELFDTILPKIVQAGIETVAGNLAMKNASEVEGVLRAAAEVFLRAGFPIADDPGGIDLSFLGELPDVEAKSIDALRPPDDMVVQVAQLDALGFGSDQVGDLLGNGTIDELLGDTTIDDILGGAPDGQPPDGVGGTLLETVFGGGPNDGGIRPIVYVSTVTEPDRNFVVNEEMDPQAGRHPLPVLNERLIARIAKLFIDERTITVRDLYRVLTDVDVGLGVRLTYALPTPGHDGPPPMVFETADGDGVARDIQGAIFDLLKDGLVDPGADFDELASRRDEIRQKMRELLAGTVPPTLERLFGAILSDRIESAEQLLNFVREARVHLPFSRSGPSTFYVVADGDPFRPDAGEVNPVSVDVEFDTDGRPARVVYNPQHTGAYYLGFTHETESANRVQLLVRETGRWMHGPHGEPVFLDMADAALFGPIDGVAFADFVSQEGTFWPGVPVAVPNPEFRLDAEGGDGPTTQLFVLADRPGEDAEPVRVNYDVSTGTFSASADGRYYMMFLPETRDQGVFGLYDFELNFMASVQDLTADRFVIGPAPVPDEPVFLPPDEGLPPPGDETLAPPDAPTTTDAAAPPPGDVVVIVDEPAAGQELPATNETATTSDGAVPPTNDVVEAPPPDVIEPPPSDVVEPPPPDGGLEPPPGPEPIFTFEPALVAPTDVVGLDVQPEFFRFVYGTEVPNERFDPAGNPYFDDVNGNGVEDPGEFTADFRPALFNPDDWRSTDVSRYYRRASGGAVTVEEIDWESPEPRASDGEVLVPRNFLPRLNAFKFGRPNSAINLLTTFMPPEFFDGKHALNADTRLGIFQALAMINLVMEQMLNVEAVVDFDGDGPFEAQRMLVDAHLFVVPIGDPLVLLIDGFETLSQGPTE